MVFLYSAIYGRNLQDTATPGAVRKIAAGCTKNRDPARVCETGADVQTGFGDGTLSHRLRDESGAARHLDTVAARPLRVAHLIHGLGLGGAQQIIRHIVAESDAASYEHLVYAGNDGVFRPDIEAAGARVCVVPRRLRLFDPLWLSALARRMREDRIAVVHTHLFGDNLHGYLAARWAGGIPVIMTLHNT